MKGRILRIAAVYGAAVACLAWVLYGVDFGNLWLQVRRVHPLWILAALAADVISTVSHGLRWQLLLMPSAALPALRTTQAIYAGLFASQVLPLRAGEFVRGYVVSRFARLPFASILPSMVTERIFDGSFLVIGIGVCAFVVDLPQTVERAGTIAGVTILVVAGILALFALLGNRRSSPTPAVTAAGRKWYTRAVAFFWRFAAELRRLWGSRQLVPAVAVTLLFVSLQVASFWFLMRAYGLSISLWTPIVTLIVIRLGTAVPGAPANIGPYQFFCVLSLTLFGIDKTTATGFAIVASVVFAIPLLTLGALAFASSGLTVSGIRQHRRETD
jgi:uncharacterized protein (TIRG00374 family)